MPRKFKIPYFFQDVIPPLLGIIFSIVYFASVQRGTGPYLKGLIITAGALLLLSRIPKVLYFKKHLIPPISEYKKAKAQGRTLSSKKLSDLYLHLASFVIKSQVLNASLWLFSIISLVIIDKFFLIGTGLSSVTMVFTGLITASISLALSYFISKWEVGPLLEEIQLQLDVVPDVKKYRVSLRGKIFVSIFGLNTVAFLALGVLLFAKISYSVESENIKRAPIELSSVTEALAASPESEWNRILSEYKSEYYCLAAYGADGKVVFSADDEYFGKKLKNIKLDLNKKEILDTKNGFILISPIQGKGSLLAVAAPAFVSPLKIVALLEAGLFFILTMMALFAGYILLLGKDIDKTVNRISYFSHKLSSGDLREMVPVWSDDELGIVGDNLRETFLSLRKMGRELDHATTIVDQEVNRTVHITHTLSEEAQHQVGIAAETGRSTEVLEKGIQKVVDSMNQVVMTTQDVSSIVLEMQASVEEIAQNSEILMKSVEKTVSSTNEMSTTAEQINSSTGILRESSQESVSFLTELDAALQETMRNATTLNDTSLKVTQDAESGFSSVAAVEEEILRSRKASGQSLEALDKLQRSMEKIGKIVDVIEEVTEQTNLLALNASIIAAGAGEYGKSFAVVATQIRELSARTAGHAKEIRRVIKALILGGDEMTGAISKTQQVVESSADLSRKAGEALKTILESASTQEELSKRISLAMEEIAHGGLTATESVNRIFQMIEGITRATEEQAKTTRLLHNESEKVREVALQLRNATQEQAKGAKVISESMIRITSDSQNSSDAVTAQAGETSLLYTNSQELLDASHKIESAFRELGVVAGALQQSASLLNEEMKKYRL
jgi:methyl-accepting chemotaxis protein